MDEVLRSRLLAMATRYHEIIGGIILEHKVLTQGKAAGDAIKVNVTAELAREWAEAKSNEQVRNAQVAQALLAHVRYQELLGQALALEESINASRMRLEALRFERDVLVAVVNNDAN